MNNCALQFLCNSVVLAIFQQNVDLSLYSYYVWLIESLYTEDNSNKEPQILFQHYCTYVDIQKFNIKYLVMYKVQMHTGAIS